MNITTERIGDFPLLLEVMQRLGLPAIIDNHLRRHGLHQGLSWGLSARKNAEPGTWDAGEAAQTDPSRRS